MTLEAGHRVRLTTDLGLAEAVAADAAGPTGAVAGFLSLGAGVEGTVERVTEHRPEPGEEVLEYERLKSLLDAYGHQMPPVSRQQLAEKVDALEPAWVAHRARRPRVSVRVRLDNGFVLDGADEVLFAAC